MARHVLTNAFRILTVISYFSFPYGVCFAGTAPSTGTTRFVLDGNRVYAELSFVRPDGSLHKALVFVDMGSPSMSLSDPLFNNLHLDRTHPLTFRAGEMKITVPSAEVTGTHAQSRPLGSEFVEGILPAGILKEYQIVLDYRKRTLTFAKPGTLKPAGIATPFHMNEETGLIAVDTIVDGKHYAVTIDNGSAWTWFRQTAVKGWLAKHAVWVRGVGAVGPSNMMMIGDLEATGMLARIPNIKVGVLTLNDVDVLGPGPTHAFPFDLFDWYSRKNAVPVLGWIGGNVLKGYRLTIDYPNRTLYWQKQTGPDTHELDQIGLTLRTQAGEYFVAAVATKHGLPTVANVEPGDRLVQVDALTLKGATWGAIFQAMHGKPGSKRILVLERNGNPVTVTAKITAF